jgi:hypothetical protein
MTRRFALASALVLAAAHPSFAAACLPHDALVRGTLRVVKAKHPNGTPIEALQLMFKPPICVTVQSTLEQNRLAKLNVTAMHLAVPQTVFRRLKKRLGSKTTAVGNIGEPHTAWHIGDAIMFDARILRISK